MLSAAELIEFEAGIAAEFEAGAIKAPVHLAGGNEAQLIGYFKDIRPNDWICCSWRSHLHCLLKGVPPDEVRAAILAGRSIALCFPEYKVLSSAIVGGICPIATGLGWAIKERGGSEKVHVFIGDMGAESGIYHECSKYSGRHSLPINWIIEDNGMSVSTETNVVWGDSQRPANVIRYRYGLTFPHVGTGKWVSF